MPDIPAEAVRETWDSVYEKSVELATLIKEHCAATGEKFDAIVVVPRGSYYPANIISRELGFTATGLLHACVTSYIPGKAERTDQLQVGQMPSGDEVRDKNLLIVEEMCDTGHTLKFLTDRFKDQGAGLIRVAVIHYKTGHSETGFKPD